jgi:NAD(P)H dehydrogenase (quinone)
MRKAYLMTTVALIYHSGMGNTERLAQAVMRGAQRVDGVTVRAYPIVDSQLSGGRWSDDAVIAELQAADAIIFGAPTYMGMVSAPFKAFADATAGLWFQMAWKDKIAGGFTTSSYASGDKVMTLHYLATLAAQLRMVWVGAAAPASNMTGDGQEIDSWGYYIGVGAMGSVRPDANLPGEGDLRTGELYGQRLAEITRRWVSTREPITAQA